MHRPAHEKFDSKSSSYELGRPTYPDAALRFLCDKLSLTSAMTVADLGAGTGLLTKSLRKHFANVIAIEPNDEMRSHLAPPALKGCAEETNLADLSIHGAFAAQAFHWFDINRARMELKRVLKAPGAVALLWNDRDANGNPGAVALEKLMSALRGNDPQSLEANESAIAAFFQSPVLKTAEFANPVELTREAFQAMVLSRSYAPRANAPEYRDLIANLDAVFDAHSRGSLFQLPYTTRVYWGNLS